MTAIKILRRSQAALFVSIEPLEAPNTHDWNWFMGSAMTVNTMVAVTNTAEFGALPVVGPLARLDRRRVDITGNRVHLLTERRSEEAVVDPAALVRDRLRERASR